MVHVPVNVTGTQYNDFVSTIYHSSGVIGYTTHFEDKIIMYAGDDTVLAGGGDDYVAGYEGNDTIYGEGGDDFIGGADGDDTLYGGGRRRRAHCLGWER